MAVCYVESIHNEFTNLCHHYLSKNANEKKHLVLHKKYEKYQLQKLRRTLYHTLFSSLFSPYIITNNPSIHNTTSVHGDNNIHSNLAEHVLSFQLLGKTKEAAQLSKYAQLARLFENPTVDNVLKVLLLLSNPKDDQVIVTQLIYEKLDETEEIECFQFDVKAMQMDTSGNDHFGCLLEPDPLFTFRGGGFFNDLPNSVAYGNASLFLKNEESTFSQLTKQTLFGGLTNSFTTSLDVSLSLPDLPVRPHQRELQFQPKEYQISVDEGFVEPSTFSSFSNTSEPVLYHDDLAVWDEAIAMRKRKTYSWENQLSYNPKFDNMYLTELGNAAFDCMYDRRICDIERFTGKMVEIGMCSSEQIFRDSLNVLVGVPSKSYIFYPMSCSLRPKSNIGCSGLSMESLNGLMMKFAQVGTHYRQLNKFSQHHSDKPIAGLSGGFILKAYIDALKEILYSYWSAVFIIEAMKKLTLTELWGIFDVFARQLKFLADICLCSEAFDRVYRKSTNPKFPIGANLMSYMYNLVIKNSSTNQYPVLLFLFKSVSKPFIRFITDWLYNGVCNDPYNEFFVLTDHQYLCYRDKHFWTQGFQMKQSKDSVPLFLDDLVDSIFACGKAINLLKLVNIQHYLFKRGFRKPEVSVTFSSVKLESIEQRCQQYVSDVHASRKQYEEENIKHKLREEEAWKNKIKKEKEDVKEAIAKMEDLENQVKQAIRNKKKETFLNLKEQFENILQERKKMREKKLLEDQYWLDEMKKYEDKEDATKKKARDELIAYYGKLSSQAEERGFRANWIIARYELSEKRRLFMDNQQKLLEKELKTMQDSLMSSKSVGILNSIGSVSMDETDAPNVDKPIATQKVATLSTMIDDFLSSGSEKQQLEQEVQQLKPKGDDHLQNVLESLKHDFNDQKLDVSETKTNVKSNQDVSEVKNLIYPDGNEMYASSYDAIHGSVLISPSSRRIALGNSAFEGDDAKRILYSNENLINDAVTNFDMNKLEGAETKNLLYPTGKNLSGNVRTVDLNTVEGAETKHLLYPTEKNLPHEIRAVDLNTVEGAETKDLLYPTGKNISGDVKTIDLNMVEGAETKNLLYPTDENLPHEIRAVDLNTVEGAETKNLLYPTGKNSSGYVKTVDLNTVEGAETKNLLYPTDENLPHEKRAVDLNTVEGAETKNLLYPSGKSSSGDVGTINLNTVEGAQAKSLLYPATNSLQNEPFSSMRIHVEGSSTKQLLYPDPNQTIEILHFKQAEREDTKFGNQTSGHMVREFERPSTAQVLLYPELHAEKISSNDELKRISRGFEPPTTITRLMYPQEDDGALTRKSSRASPLTAEEVWMDSVVEPFQDDFSIMDKDPQPYLFGNTNHSIAQHFSQSEPDKDADIIRQLPLEIIIKRSLTLPIQAQISLVNTAVIKYFIEDLNIEVHFDAFRKFLLLEDGEFGHSLCSQLFKKISSGMKPQEFCNTIRLNNIIIEALRLSLYASQIEYSNQLTFSLKWIPDVFQPSDVDALDFLELRYRVPWPCNIIVTENSITKYNKVFSFLLKLKKAGWSLQEVWINLKKAGHDKKAAMSPQLRQLQLYRHEMQHFVNNLERYVVNQIIHVSWREFQHDLQNKVHSLDDLHRCHVSYLNKIIFRSLLSKNAAPVYKLINDIFGMISKFEARLLTTPWQRDEATGFVTHALFRKLKAVHGAFKQCGEFLFSIISKLVRRGYQDHLDDLLLQVNFNAYYTTAMVKK